ncbi:hypothetical protein CYMTET_54941 [Cymbomonas tetramitiformis]|uniref:Uncharacterized protein n=1 Tax=Cymbomonas tetramitiformis TaxID=36881 RepID=A0AAE0BDX1_9CHLO|nr:hypothetical protein CYMTET_54941 [Cymbomonas tetramitiformis]
MSVGAHNSGNICRCNNNNNNDMEIQEEEEEEELVVVVVVFVGILGCVHDLNVLHRLHQRLDPTGPAPPTPPPQPVPFGVLLRPWSASGVPSSPPSQSRMTGGARLTRDALVEQLKKLLGRFEVCLRKNEGCHNAPACGFTSAPATQAVGTGLDMIDSISSSHSALLGGEAGAAKGQEEVEASQKHVITRALRLVECTTHLLPSSAGSPPRRHDWLVSMHLIARELADSPGGSDHCGSGFWTALLTAWKAALMHLGVWEPWAVRSHRTVESLLMNIDPKCTGSDGSTSTTWPWEIVPSAATRTPVEGERSREEATVMSDEGAPVEREVHEAHIGAQLPEAWRSAQVPLFNGAVRRDIYNILLHPAHPYAGATPAASGQGSAFEVVIAVKADAAGQHQVYALLPRNSWMPTGFKVLSDTEIMQAISQIGEISPYAHAVTVAFERFLSALAKDKWHSAQHTAQLSVEFLVAFGTELTPRLGINNRICTQRLSLEAKQTLSNAPYAAYVDQAMLQSFQ